MNHQIRSEGGEEFNQHAALSCLMTPHTAPPIPAASVACREPLQTLSISLEKGNCRGLGFHSITCENTER